MEDRGCVWVHRIGGLPAGFTPPRCSCGAYLRPGVVWFGESLPERAFLAASRAASACDLFLCVGTSASVYPAAAFPLLARRQGAYVVEVDQDVTSVSDLVDESIRGKATEIMPQLAAMARGSR